MSLISSAEKSIVRNWRTVLVYVLATMAVVTVFDACHMWLDDKVPADVAPKPVWFVVTSLALDLGIAAVVAALQAVCFAAIGAEIDRPLWKYAGPMDALRRLFMLWFIINLIFFVIVRLQGSLSAQGLEYAAGALLLPRLFWTCAYMPVAVCIMYGGNLVWQEVPDRLAPIFHLFPQAMVAFGLGLAQFFVLFVLFASLPAGFEKSILINAAINLPLVLIECLTFAVMWIICMEYRDTAADHDDFDF